MSERAKRTLITRSDEGDAKNSTAWMLTFADLLSLLLAFFIMTYAMSSLNKSEWDNITHILGQTFNERNLVDQVSFSKPMSIKEFQVKQGLNLDYLYSILAVKVEADPFMKEYVGVHRYDSRLVISVGTKAFLPDEQALELKATAIIYELAENLKKINNHVEVHSYMDSSIFDGAFSDSYGWGETLRRGMIVADELQALVKKPIHAFVRDVSSVEHLGLIDTQDEVPFSPSERVDIILTEEKSRHINQKNLLSLGQ